MKKRLVCLWLISVVIGYFPFVFADAIILKSGKQVDGRILEKNEKYIKLDFQGVQLTYFLDEISQIKEDKLKVFESETDKNNVVFGTPSQWIEVEPLRKNDYAYITNEDPKKKLFVYIQFFRSPEKAILDFANEQAKRYRAEGGQVIVEPKEITEGILSWVLLEAKFITKEGVSVIKDEYFAKLDGSTMISVKIGGPEDVLGSFNREELDQFLSSFKLQSKSLLDEKKNEIINYLTDTKEPKKGDIINAVIAVAAGSGVPNPGDIYETGSGKRLFISMKKISDGSMSATALTAHKFKYKILSIDPAIPNSVVNYENVDLYRSKVEVIEDSKLL